MCFNKVEGPKTLKRHTLVKNNMTQITGDFIKKIREIFKESEKLYETEEKIKLQTQNSATSLAELFIEQIDNEILRDKKKRKAEGYSVERREDRRAAESQCYRHITNKREGHIFTKSSQTLPLIHYWHSQKFPCKNLTRTRCASSDLLL